jgi:hypothetical protein
VLEGKTTALTGGEPARCMEAGVQFHRSQGKTLRPGGAVCLGCGSNLVPAVIVWSWTLFVLTGIFRIKVDDN